MHVHTKTVTLIIRYMLVVNDIDGTLMGHMMNPLISISRCYCPTSISVSIVKDPCHSSVTLIVSC